MKIQDITYKLTDKAIIPDKMGVVSVALYDWTKYNYYENSVAEIDYILQLCDGYDIDTEVNEAVETETPHGFYRKYVYFFVIDVDEQTEITYFPRIPQGDNDRYRHWIDGRIAFIGKEGALYTFNLEKGKHIFCIEYCVELQYRNVLPLVRIESIDSTLPHLTSITHNNYLFKNKKFIINTKTLYIQENRILKFSLIPLDLVNYNFDSKIRMFIKSESTDSIVYTKDLSFKEEYEIDLSFLPNMDEDLYCWLYAFFEVEDIHGCVFQKSIPIIRYNPNPDYTNKIKVQSEKILNNEQLPERIANELYYYYNKLISVRQDLYYGKKLYNLLQIICENKVEEYLYKTGPQYIYYYSEADNNYYYYYIVLPDNYDPKREYPLLLTISHGHITDIEHETFNMNYSQHFASRNDAIFADIGGRGCTLGSYMGEYFILNELKDILNRFRIDKKRIYATAHCAGNIALVNLAQTYPHLFAGIFTRMTRLYHPNICNLYNIPWIHLIASINEKDEFLIKRRLYEKILRNIKFLFVHKFYNADNELKQIQYTEKTIDLLMSKELDEYPDIIYYRTERNRARKAYYIEIESIQSGKEFAEFTSEIVGYNLEINTKNCTGLKITIPPQINREYFYIKINGKKLFFKNFYKEHIYLKRHIKKGFEISNSLNENICCFKGTGLLDIYMSTLRIVNCNSNNTIMNSVCNSFCNPITNTAYSYIYVNYPIISESEILDNLKNSMLIVDNNCAVGEFINDIKEKLPIKMDNNGFCYKDKTFEGEYCIMQIISNPWDSDKSILYINTNDIDLYSRNLFTRTVMIPSYTSGRHPYWNENAIYFDGKKYYTIHEWGEDFKEVTT